ncbi:MAG: hypothetical protein IJU96_06895 [Clostridia bacterium]|nr:hypothetical protein [Clostridia bacterium]
MKQAKWIWYPGEFEIYHHMLLSFRRQEFGCDYPCVWHVSRPEASARFFKTFTAKQGGSFTVVTHGKGMVRIGGRLRRVNEPIEIEAGRHEIAVELFDLNAFPSFYINSDVLITDESWTAEAYDAVRVPAACSPAFCSPADDPAVFPFCYRELSPVSVETIDGGLLYDFGREQFGPVRVTLPAGAEIKLVYGESREEALDAENAILRETLTDRDKPDRPARAFRYLAVLGEAADDVTIEAREEYLPIEDKASFSSDEPLLNDVWALCARTFHLNTREFFLDGIKRDRWVWSGDAYQSFMIARYLYNDPSVTERTIIALLGKPPYKRHINTINDYSAYLIISLWEHFNASGRLDFVRTVWANVKALYAFITSRLDKNGYAVRREGDWIFVDWGELDKTDPVCFEQIVLWQAHRAMAALAAALGEADEYTEKADALRERILRDFWDAEKGAFVDSFTSGKRFVTRQTNIFAVLYGLVEGQQKQSVIEKALLNPDLPPITTPYFKLYELLALCEVGAIDAAQDFIASYWGGMLQEGATSVWEAYDPRQSGAEHFAMYGSPYGKSLCHAWGSGPILLLCRYVAGVSLTQSGGFRVAPKPGHYRSFDATVPVENGEVSVKYENGVFTVHTTAPGGVFFDGRVETALDVGKEYTFILNDFNGGSAI